jgi:hypothetical protein
MRGPVSVVEGAATAFGDLVRFWSRAAGALGLVALLDTTLVLAVAHRNFGRAAALAAAGMVAAAMARGALFHVALGRRPPSELGVAGFRWGGAEWRLLAVALLRAFLFGLLIALLLTLLGALYVGLAAAQPGAGGVASPEHWRRTLDPVGRIVVSAVALAGTCGLVWVGLRLFLAFPATVALNRVQLLSTWALTHGQVWRVLGAAVLVSAPLAALAFALLSARGYLGLNGRAAAWGLGHGFLALPLSAGLMSYVYDRLCPDAAGAD